MSADRTKRQEKLPLRRRIGMGQQKEGKTAQAGQRSAIRRPLFFDVEQGEAVRYANRESA